jgi:hypothetical protein
MSSEPTSPPGGGDLVDLVEDLVVEPGLSAGQQVVEVGHRATPDDRRGHTRVGDRERHRKVSDGQARLLGERDDLLNRIKPALVAQVPEAVRGPVSVRLLALAVAAGQQAAGQRTPHQRAHAVALADRQYLALDPAVEDRVRRLLGAEALQAAPLSDPLGPPACPGVAA